MEGAFAGAAAIVNRGQPNLDGGFFLFYLNTFLVRYLKPAGNESSSPVTPSYTSHFGYVVGSGGYVAGITFGTFWIIGLIVGLWLVCRLRHRRKNATSNRPYATVHRHYIENSEVRPHRNVIEPCLTVNSTLSTKSTWYLTRRKLQSNWICLALQFILLSLLVALLALTIILGIVTNGQLHANLIAQPYYNFTSLQLPRPEKVPPTESRVFPGLFLALAHVRSYLTNFLNSTRSATAPAVDSLIHATIAMQNATTMEFNDLLFEKMGVKKAFDLGTKLGEHTVLMMQRTKSITDAQGNYSRVMAELSPIVVKLSASVERLSQDRNLVICPVGSVCSNVQETLISKLTIGQSVALKEFDFAVALNFLTFGRNQTPETIRRELSHGRAVAATQLSKTMERMRDELDIPGSIHALLDQQWNSLQPNIDAGIQFLDEKTLEIAESAVPKVVVASSVLLAISSIQWICLFCLVFGLCWLIYQYHCVPIIITSAVRRKVRCAGSCGLLVLAFTLITSAIGYLVGGYIFTEGCRYIQPNRPVTVFLANTETYPTGQSYAHLTPVFALDYQVDAFLDRHWENITNFATQLQLEQAGAEAMPLPRIRSPVKALYVRCQEDVGILEAFDAIKTFDFSTMNKPELTDRLLSKGKEIMVDTLREINSDDMFPTSLTNSLEMASQLDSFLVPFDSKRENLPREFMARTVLDGNVTVEKSMSIEEVKQLWQDYNRTFLSVSNISETQKLEVSQLANKLFSLLDEASMYIDTVDTLLRELEKVKPISSTVTELKEVLSSLKSRLKDRNSLIQMSVELYDVEIGDSMPKKVAQLMNQLGPGLMQEVGHCRRLHEAYTVGVTAVCSGIVLPLNGFWLFSGVSLLFGTIALGLGLALLLHKLPPMMHEDQEKSRCVDAQMGTVVITATIEKGLRRTPPPIPPTTYNREISNASDGPQPGLHELEPLNRMSSNTDSSTTH